MTSGAWAALALGAVFGIGNWVAVLRGRTRLEYVSKPATLAALVVVALALDPTNDAQRAWFVAALAWSLLGDVLLMLPGDRFVAGLTAFLVAHLCYLPGLLLDDPSLLALVVAAVVVLVALVPLTRRIRHGITTSGHAPLRAPVTGYVVVIAAMLTAALATGDAWAGAGAVLFAGSDSMIAWNRFVRPFAWAHVAVMVTYHLGQTGLVVSLVR